MRCYTDIFDKLQFLRVTTFLNLTTLWPFSNGSFSFWSFSISTLVQVNELLLTIYCNDFDQQSRISKVRSSLSTELSI